MEQFATPALETPVGHIVVLMVGLVFAISLWQNRQSIDLFFFRITRGNVRAGRLAAAGVPMAAFFATCLIVWRWL